MSSRLTMKKLPVDTIKKYDIIINFIKEKVVPGSNWTALTNLEIKQACKACKENNGCFISNKLWNNQQHIKNLRAYMAKVYAEVNYIKLLNNAFNEWK
jgi:hypothetical protein